MKIQRYRLRAWIPDRPDLSVKQHLSLRCRVCAMGRAMDLAVAAELRFNRAEGTATWTVEALDGHINGWKVIACKEHIPEPWVRRHGH